MNMKTNGFTLVETMVSFMLISLALVSISIFTANAFNGNAMSNARFMMWQEIESRKNGLLSKPFNSTELKTGSYSEETRLFTVKWNIRSISGTLKAVRLNISYRNTYGKRTVQSDFYKSKYINPIKEITHD